MSAGHEGASVGGARERDIEDVLREAGYEVGPVPEPTRSYGCVKCGDPHAETVNGWCIKCAAKTAPTYWDGDL